MEWTLCEFPTKEIKTMSINIALFIFYLFKVARTGNAVLEIKNYLIPPVTKINNKSH
jgi:hypothetical protein